VLEYPDSAAELKREVALLPRLRDPRAFFVEKLTEGSRPSPRLSWPKPVIVRLSDFNRTSTRS